jgi:hypothetical protein
VKPQFWQVACQVYDMAQFGTVTSQEGTLAATNRCCFFLSSYSVLPISGAGCRSIATEIWVSVCDRTPPQATQGGVRGSYARLELPTVRERFDVTLRWVLSSEYFAWTCVTRSSSPATTQ